MVSWLYLCFLCDRIGVFSFATKKQIQKNTHGLSGILSISFDILAPVDGPASHVFQQSCDILCSLPFLRNGKKAQKYTKQTNGSESM